MTIPSPKVSSRPSSTAPNSLIASSRTTRPVPSAPSSFPGTTTSTTTPELGCSPPPPSITPWLTPSSPNASKPCTPLAPHTPNVSSTVYPNRNRYHTSSGSTRPTIPRQSLDPKWKSSPKLHRAIVPMLLTRSATFRAMLEWLHVRADRRPTLFVVEDLHWVDASTLEFLGQFLDEGLHDRVLTVLTFL